jgi:6-hydroxytryprostatin B O-methyltransferase
MTSGLFDEPAPHVVAHSLKSRDMATDESLLQWAQYISNTIIPTASKHVEATTRWPNSRNVNETAHNIAFDHDIAYFDFVSEDTSKAIEFARTMQAVSNTDSFNNCHLVESFDWGSIENGLIVDVSVSSTSSSMVRVMQKLTAFRLADPRAMHR